MSHLLYNEKFLSYRQPAWHGLGQVIDEEIGAVEAGNRIGLPDIYTEPVVTLSGLPTENKAIIGKLVEGPKVFSVVGTDYREITHKGFTEVWDLAVKNHVETIGLLQGGAGLFLSAKLPSFDVKGEEVLAYILAENWLTGNRSTKVRKTPVRVVCWNTLQLSDRASLEEIRIVHTGTAYQQLAKSLEGLIERSTSEYRAIKEVFEILASTKVTDGQAQTILTDVYPNNPIPEGLQARASSDADALDQLAAWERSNGSQVLHRSNCYNLYAGAGVGSLSAAAAGTAWGVYNAAAEYEQYLKKRRQSESVAFGAGKDRVADAFEAVCTFAGIKDAAFA